MRWAAITRLRRVVEGAVAAARHLAVRLALVGHARVIEQALSVHGDWSS